MVLRGSSVWNKIKSWFSVGKVIILGVLGFFVLITTVILNISGVWDRFFPHEDIVFRTTDIFPNPADHAYPLGILSGGEIVPIANPLPDESAPTEVWGPPDNILFTVTNNSRQELLVDKIEAILTEYQNIPEKCIYTCGAFDVLRPIDLLLVLSPEQNKYDLSRGKYLAIAGGKTEHVFQVWVAGLEPGIYEFKIQLRGRIGGTKELVIESDSTYSFLVPDWSKGALSVFLYDGDVNDPNFRELIGIIDKPLSEFKQIVSGWGEYKLLDNIHNAPPSLRDFIGLSIPSRESSTITEMPPSGVTADASELVLSIEDLALAWSRIEFVEPKKELDVSEENLPSWILKTQSSYTPNGPISKHSVKYSMSAPSIEVIYNTVAVYPTVELARQAYLGLQPRDREVFRIADTEIGDEYYMTIGTSARDWMRTLVFQKKNVVVAIVCIRDSPLLESYARIIESKI